MAVLWVMSPCRLVGGFNVSVEFPVSFFVVNIPRIRYLQFKKDNYFKFALKHLCSSLWIVCNEVGWWLFLSSDIGYIPFPHWKWILLVDCIVSYQRGNCDFLHVSWTGVNRHYCSECVVTLTVGKLISNCSFTFTSAVTCSVICWDWHSENGGSL